MQIARSLQDISNKAYASLQPEIVSVTVPTFDTSNIRLGFIRPYTDLSEMSMETVKVDQGAISKLVGILFCFPDSRFAREDILPFLDYFNLRTGKFVDVYCAGYGIGLRPEHYPIERTVPNVDGKNWWFDLTTFNNIRKELEKKSNWSFSGETDLILLTAHRNPTAEGCLSLSHSLACNLEQMVKDKAISSPRSFMEAISRLGETYTGADPVARLSDRQGLKVGVNAIKEALLTLFPEGVRKEYRKAEHFAIRSISR